MSGLAGLGSVQGDYRVSVQGYWVLTLIGASRLSRVGARSLTHVGACPRRGRAAWRTRASMPSTPRPRLESTAVRRSFMRRRKLEIGGAIHPARVPSTRSHCRQPPQAIRAAQRMWHRTSNYRAANARVRAQTISRRASRDRDAVCPRRFSTDAVGASGRSRVGARELPFVGAMPFVRSVRLQPDLATARSTTPAAIIANKIQSSVELRVATSDNENNTPTTAMNVPPGS